MVPYGTAKAVPFHKPSLPEPHIDPGGWSILALSARVRTPDLKDTTAQDH